MIVDEVETFVRRFVVLDDDEALLVALWILHTHVFKLFPETPYAAITSPEKRCGKTQLMKVLALTCKDAWSAILPSEAVVYRYIDARQPTLLLDETDSIFKPANGDKYEALRTLLNEGNHAGATVPRCVGASKETIVEFSTFCPKALAGIGTLPDTITDRSIPIRLERKTRDQVVERFRILDVAPEGAKLRKKIARWAKQVEQEEQLDLRPEVPDELNDRAQDISEPLVSIADSAGCGDRARKALVSVFTRERVDDAETVRITLLRDLQRIFDAHPTKEGLATQTLLTGLDNFGESPWCHWYGRGFNERDLAGMLRPFKIKSVDVRIGKTVLKGYRRDDLYPVWDRYHDEIVADVADVAHSAEGTYE